MDMKRVGQLVELIEGAIDHSKKSGKLSITLPNGAGETLTQTIKQQQEQIDNLGEQLKTEKELVIENIEYARTTFGAGATTVEDCEFLKRWQEDTKQALEQPHETD